MELSARQIRAHRLRAQRAISEYPFGELAAVAGTCGLQNSPPGAWETAAFCRLKNCTLPQLHQALYQKKELLQAWSIRGVPLIFPTADSDVFLSALIAQEGEEPWIYTKGIGLALDHLGMSFAELLPLVESAAEYLEDHTIKSKEELDRVLAQLVAEQLPAQKQSLWNAPSMYGAPDRQTVGGAAVSFLLRPCSFKGLVVFGEREGISPTFTSPLRWLGHKLVPSAQGTAELARRFLHAYGPATPRTFADWLGSSPAQAKRLWRQIEEELEPVTAAGKKAFILQADRESFRCADTEEALLLLGPHDPLPGYPRPSNPARGHRRPASGLAHGGQPGRYPQERENYRHLENQDPAGKTFGDHHTLAAAFHPRAKRIRTTDGRICVLPRAGAAKPHPALAIQILLRKCLLQQRDVTKILFPTQLPLHGNQSFARNHRNTFPQNYLILQPVFKNFDLPIINNSSGSVRHPLDRTPLPLQLVRQLAGAAKVDICGLFLCAIEHHRPSGNQPVLCPVQVHLLQLLKQGFFVKHFLLLS